MVRYHCVEVEESPYIQKNIDASEESSNVAQCMPVGNVIIICFLNSGLIINPRFISLGLNILV